MPEILTESFCERCGTRYTFESAAPKQKRLGRFKVLSQGFKNFVMSDDTSLDEAFAAARNDEEREAVTQQLDAFHKTFNFCMNCRQYTCSNCWNDAEGRCLTCSPHLGHDVLATPFPALETNGNGAAAEDAPRLDGLAWPTLDLPPESPAAGADLTWPDPTEASGAPTAEPASTQAPDVATSPWREDGLPDWASLVPEEGVSAAQPEAAAPAEPSELESLPAHPMLATDKDQAIEAPAEEAAATQAPDEVGVAEVRAESTADEAAEAPVAELLEPADDEGIEPLVVETAEVAAEETPEPVVAETAEVAVEETPEPVVETAEVAADEAAEPVAEEAPERVAAEAAPSPVDDRVAAAAVQTSELLARFRPGQSIDAALDEYEASLAAQAPEAEASAGLVADVAAKAEAAHETPLETVPATPLDEVLAEPPAEAEIAAAIAEEEPAPSRPQEVTATEPEPVAAAEPNPVASEPEPMAAEPEPVASEPEPMATEPEPVAAAEARPTPPAPPRAPAEDRVEVPVWRIVAPETPPAPTGQPAETSLPTAASAEQPQWPQTAAWPGEESQVDVSFLAARLSRKPANDALWAASSRDVLAPLPQQPAPPAVQTCVTCGLSLSATARFCRRCGSRQGA